MYCEHCGTENADNAIFCEGCGRKIESISETNTKLEPSNEKGKFLMASQPTSTLFLFWYIGIAVLGGIEIIALIIYFGLFGFEEIFEKFWIVFIDFFIGIVSCCFGIKNFNLFRQVYINVYEHRVIGKALLNNSVVAFDYAISEIERTTVRGVTISLHINGLSYVVGTKSQGQAAKIVALLSKLKTNGN